MLGKITNAAPIDIVDACANRLPDGLNAVYINNDKPNVIRIKIVARPTQLISSSEWPNNNRKIRDFI